MPKLSNDVKQGFDLGHAIGAKLTRVDTFKAYDGGQDQFFHSQKHQVILGGGNKAGKTYCGVAKVAYRSLPELDKYGNPTGWLRDPYVRSRVPTGRRIEGWISTYSQRVQQMTVQPMFETIMGSYLKDSYMEKGLIHSTHTDIADIHFQWITAEGKTYTGASLDFLYMDEPHPRPIYNESITRLLGKKGYAWITLTPVIDAKDPDAARKMQWIAWMRDELILPWEADHESMPELDVVYVDIEENPHIDADFALRMWAGLTQEERLIRKTGMFLDYIGGSWFDEEMVQVIEKYQREHPEECQPDYGILEYDDSEGQDNYAINFISTTSDFPDKPKSEYIWKMWERPVGDLDSGLSFGARCNYVMGVDPAQGKRGLDYTSVYVRRLETGAVVAALHGHLSERELARELWLGGMYYCSADGRPARLAVEIGPIGRVTVSHLVIGDKEYGTPVYDLGCLYKHPSIGQLQRGRYSQKSDVNEYGWITTPKTRGYLLNEMRNALANCYYSILNGGQCLIPDHGWIREARTFILTPNGKWEAASSCHDDRLFALGITDMALLQRSPRVRVMPKPEEIVNESAFYHDGRGVVLNLEEIRRRAGKEEKKALWM